MSGLQLTQAENGEVFALLSRNSCSLSSVLEEGKTYLYLLHQKEYQPLGMDYSYPNTYATVFICNHGHHSEIYIDDGDLFNSVDTANLTSDSQIQCRDLRKKAAKFSY